MRDPFSKRTWIKCPGVGAIHRADLRPCPCGGHVFLVILQPGSPIPRSVCKACLEAGRLFSMYGRPIEHTPLGQVDARNGRTVTYTAHGYKLEDNSARCCT